MDAVNLAKQVAVFGIDVGQDIVNVAVQLVTTNYDIAVGFLKSLVVLGG